MEPGSSSVRPSNPSDSGSVPVNSRATDIVYNMPHLQMSGGGLDIFPRPDSPTMKKLMQRQGEHWMSLSLRTVFDYMNVNLNTRVSKKGMTQKYYLHKRKYLLQRGKGNLTLQ